MAELEYRVMTPEDIAACREDITMLTQTILAENITQHYPEDLAEQYVSKMPGYIADGSACVVGALLDGELAGFSWAYELAIFGERRLHIDMIGIKPRYQKRGIARHLVEIQMEEARKRGIRILEAMTTKGNAAAYTWFHSLGFEDERVKVRLDLGE